MMNNLFRLSNRAFSVAPKLKFVQGNANLKQIASRTSGKFSLFHNLFTDDNLYPKFFSPSDYLHD